MSSSELARLTGLTTGAMTGVVARLERSGWLRRRPDPDDRRRQILQVTDQALRDIETVLDGLPGHNDDLLAGFDAIEVAAVHRYLARSLEYLHHRTATLRAGWEKPTPTEREITS